MPEGGSSWDIEHYPGCFIATATVWLATLRVLERLATEFAPERLERLHSTFEQASATVESMWTGRGYYLKCLDPATGQSSDDVFAGQLAGEWVVRQLGLPSVLPEPHVREALQTLYRLNGNQERFRLMPIQVRHDGTLPERKYAWHAWPQYSMVFVDCLALHLGMREPALENVRAFDRVVHEVNRSPWATTLWHDARTGEPDFGGFMGLDWYMNAPAVWWVLPALSGVGLDVPSGELRLNPPTLKKGETLSWPVVTPLLFGRISLSFAGETPGVELTVHRFWGDVPVALRSLKVNGSSIALTTPLLLEEGTRVRWPLPPT